MDGNQNPVPNPKASSQPGTLSSQMIQTRPLSETPAELDRPQPQNPYSKAAANYFQLAAQPQSVYCELRKTAKSVTKDKGQDVVSHTLPESRPTPSQDKPRVPPVVPPTVHSVSRGIGRMSFRGGSENVTQAQVPDRVSRRPDLPDFPTGREYRRDRRPRSVQSASHLPNHSRSRASLGSPSSPMTPMSAFNLDDSGANPNYVVHEAINVSNSNGNRRGSGSGRHIRSSITGMGSHACDPNYLEHLEELRKVAEAAKALQPEEESWD